MPSDNDDVAQETVSDFDRLKTEIQATVETHKKEFTAAENTPAEGDKSQETPAPAEKTPAKDDAPPTPDPVTPAPVDPMADLRAKFDQFQAEMRTMLTRVAAPPPPLAWNPAPPPAPEQPPALDPNLYDPEVVKAIQWQQNRLASIEAEKTQMLRKMQQLERQTAGISLAEQRRAGEALQSKVDAEFAKRTDYADVVGDGPTAALPAGSEQAKTREHILLSASAIVAGYRAMNREPPPFENAFDMAFHAVMGNQIKTRAEESVRKAVRERSSASITRPPARVAGAQLTGQDKVIAAVDAYIKNNVGAATS